MPQLSETDRFERSRKWMDIGLQGVAGLALLVLVFVTLFYMVKEGEVMPFLAIAGFLLLLLAWLARSIAVTLRAKPTTWEEDTPQFRYFYGKRFRPARRHIAGRGRRKSARNTHNS